METRMERYAKYREQIKRMAPDQFAPKKVEQQDLDSAKEATIPGFAATMEEGEKTSSAPYSLYLKKRKRWLLVKIVALVLVVTAFVVWWFLLQGRKP